MQISPCSQSCAIIVTYNPDITALLELSSQLKKESDFIIVDNGTQGIASIVDSITVYEKCKAVICLEKNEGLARALNIGITWAQEQNYDFVLLFDQDSSLCDLYVQRMIVLFLMRVKKLYQILPQLGLG